MPRSKKIVTNNEIIEEVEVQVEEVKEESTPKEEIVEVKKNLGNPKNPVECGSCTSTYGKGWCLSCVVFRKKLEEDEIKKSNQKG